MARKSQKIGAAGEQVAESRLRGIGLEMVEKIASPVKLIPLPTIARNALNRLGINPNGIYRVIFSEKVSGDRRAIIPDGGRSVLIETKTILDRNLRWTDLRDHQPDALSRHSELGGCSLLVWVHESGIYVMQWPVPGFAKGKSITPEQAAMLDVDNIRKLF